MVSQLSGNPQLSMLRLDLMDPITGGNKGYKLSLVFQQMRELQRQTLVTFGGAYSNHIAASAALAKQQGFNSVGFIRGEPVFNNTLEHARANGMELRFLTRTDYRKKTEPEFVEKLLTGLERPYVVPEGGASEEGVRGAMEMMNQVTDPFDIICVSCGTGATLAGIVRSMPQHTTAIGFSVLNDQGSIEAAVRGWTSDGPQKKWRVTDRFSFGGYAKSTFELKHFCEKFTADEGIPVEPIYTGKMLYGIKQLLLEGNLERTARILCIHTGGLQYLLHQH